MSITKKTVSIDVNPAISEVVPSDCAISASIKAYSSGVIGGVEALAYGLGIRIWLVPRG